MTIQKNLSVCSPLISFSKIAGGAAVAVSVLVIIGWILGLPTLISVVPGLATMKANTALGFILAGSSLWFSQSQEPDRQRRFARVYSVAVIVLSVLTLAEYFADLDLGIDELLFRDPFTARSSYPGRMAPATALNFLLLGVALLFLDRETTRGNRPSEWCALVAGLIALIAVIGYAYNVQSLYRLAPYASMAVHTASTFLLLSVGILCARPERGLMALFSGDTIGGLMVRRLLPAGMVVIFCLGWLRLAGQRAGLYDTEFGLALMVVLTTVTLTVLIWLNALSLNRAEGKIIRANRLYAVLSQINQSIVHTRDREKLFSEVCRIAVQYGLFRIAWIGLLDGSAQSIKWAANARKEIPLPQAMISLFDNSEAHQAIREDRYFVCNDMTHDPRMMSWRTAAKNFGCHSLSAFPIHMQGRVGGVLCLCADEAGFFNEDEIKLIQEVTLDISFAIATIDGQARRERAEAALEESEARKGAILDSALDCIITIDHEGNIVEFNPAAERTFGYDRREVAGKPLADLIIPPSLRDKHRHGLAHYLATGEGPILDKRLELPAMRADGTEFHVELAVTRINKQDPPIFTAFLRDLTEQKALEATRNRSRELEEQNRRMDEASRLKSEFLANMSHELRTPLNAVIGFSELLVDEKVGALNGAQREYLTDIWTSGQHLLQLVNDVLDLAKVEAGKLELNPEVFSITAAIAETSTIVRAIASKKNIPIILEAPAREIVATLDPLRFKQILYNLLSNAVKFTDNHGVVTVTTSLDDGDQLRLQVKDTGIGIKKEDLPRLFREFEQLDTILSKRQQGTGLGLALTKKIVELLNGSITVDSEFGHGTTFTVVLPIVGGN